MVLGASFVCIGIVADETFEAGRAVEVREVTREVDKTVRLNFLKIYVFKVNIFLCVKNLILLEGWKSELFMKKTKRIGSKCIVRLRECKKNSNNIE